ncbi:osmotically-inducible lipoprotein OsmE [Pseudomonas sp. UBA2684]|uniref:osmotically-inducible lipoprotein OsmE n=1 Tax=Pseudomonas sp. UBA2684 TaxID=1947311 RepID=UPI000E95A302|nr:osmotically-inducible lipoprotein OsmE [Pseudomonas sp. UBA2684]HBX54637.1 osmotically-inducible lipoprotein OsmE [Pseudomonas sp.]|tara:strand:- start:28383 stop:28751 length:369 start_codon:yes stop_codon:yes gene_type:complete
MYKQTLGAVCVLTTLAGCAGKPENPVDYLTYRDEPLVQQVDLDMNKQHVLEIGGPPSSQMTRTVEPGTCQDYILNKDGHQQAYHVSFNSAARVDGKGFMTCKQMESNERARANRNTGGGGGY